MIHPTRPPANHRLSATRASEVEGLLRRFYRSEMPKPWPDAPEVVPLVEQTPRPLRVGVKRYFRAPVRLAVAASVALLVIGYLALQTWFPEPRPNVGIGVDTRDPMSQRTGIPKPRQPAARAPQQGGAQEPNHPMLLPVQQLPAKK